VPVSCAGSWLRCRSSPRLTHSQPRSPARLAVVPLQGTEGVALLLTTVVEIMSSFGLAGLKTLSNGRGLTKGSPREIDHVTRGQRGTVKTNLPLAYFPEAARTRRLPYDDPEPPVVCPPDPAEGRAKTAQASTQQAFGQARRQDLGRGSGQFEPARARRVEAAATLLARDGSAQGRMDRQVAARAVEEFVGSLQWDKDARATGSELAWAYATQRASRGWPDLMPNVFGQHLKSAIVAAGGRKIKAGRRKSTWVFVSPLS